MKFGIPVLLTATSTFFIWLGLIKRKFLKYSDSESTCHPIAQCDQICANMKMASFLLGQQ